MAKTKLPDGPVDKMAKGQRTTDNGQRTTAFKWIYEMNKFSVDTPAERIQLFYDFPGCGQMEKIAKKKKKNIQEENLLNAS